MIKKINLIFCSVIIVFFYNSKVFASDEIYSLMHNNQQGIIIGQVTKREDDTITVKVNNQISSSKDMNSTRVKQIPLRGEIKIEDVKVYNLFCENNLEEGKIRNGDYVLASVNKKQNENFKIVNGLYHVDSDNYKNLNVLSIKGDYSLKQDAIAIKIFVNSNGNQTEFKTDKNKLYCNGRLVYDSSRDVTFINANSSENGIEKENIDLLIKETPNVYVSLFIGVGVIFMIIIYLVKKKKI